MRVPDATTMLRYAETAETPAERLVFERLAADPDAVVWWEGDGHFVTAYGWRPDVLVRAACAVLSEERARDALEYVPPAHSGRKPEEDA